MPFTSMLDKSKFLTVHPGRWTNTHARVVMQAASYPQVERVFVNPAIKKKLCDTWQGDRSALGKVRPIYGHDEHFHIRIHCPRSEEHTSELQSLMRISYAVFCLKKKQQTKKNKPI